MGQAREVYLFFLAQILCKEKYRSWWYRGDLQILQARRQSHTMKIEVRRSWRVAQLLPTA